MAKKKTKALKRKNTPKLNISVSVTKCIDCPVEDVCQLANRKVKSCSAADDAVKTFIAEVGKSTAVDSLDLIGLRTLSSQYATLAVYELYLSKFGSVMDDDGDTKPNGLSKEYSRLSKQFLDGLDKYGMTPSGRKNLVSTKFIESGMGNFEDYITKTYAISDVEKE